MLSQIGFTSALIITLLTPKGLLPCVLPNMHYQGGAAVSLVVALIAVKLSLSFNLVVYRPYMSK